MTTDTPRPLAEIMAGVSATWDRCGPDTPIERVTRDAADAGPADALVVFPALRQGGSADEAEATRAGLLITHAGWPRPPHRPAVIVDDPRAAFGQIAANVHHHPAERLTIAGVSGTNGKTTSAWLVSAMLRVAGRRHARLGTAGNRVVDLDVASRFTSPPPFEFQGLLAETLRRGGTDVIMEVSTHALDQRRLWPARLHVAGLTNVTRDHLDYHESDDAYRACKRSLAEHITPGGLAVAMVDGQPDCVAFLDAARRRGCRAWSVSRAAGGDAQIRPLGPRTPDGLPIVTPVGPGLLRTRLLGDFNIENALVALGVGLGLGLGLDDALTGIAAADPPPGRQAWVSPPGRDRIGVMIDFAHNPDGLIRMLRALRPLVHGRLWVVAGCGGERDVGKRPLMGRAAVEGADRFVVTMDNPRHEDPARIAADMIDALTAAERRRVDVIIDRAAAIRHAIAHAASGDVVLLAGLSDEDTLDIGGRLVPHSDRAVARAALDAMGSRLRADAAPAGSDGDRGR